MLLLERLRYHLHVVNMRLLLVNYALEVRETCTALDWGMLLAILTVIKELFFIYDNDSSLQLFLS